MHNKQNNLFYPENSVEFSTTTKKVSLNLYRFEIYYTVILPKDKGTTFETVFNTESIVELKHLPIFSFQCFYTKCCTKDTGISTFLFLPFFFESKHIPVTWMLVVLMVFLCKNCSAYQAIIDMQ